MANMSKTRQELSEMFLAALKEDKLPWEAVWNVPKPLNPVSGVTYRGVNNLMLSYIAKERGYTDPRWCTFHQAQNNGWRIQKGAKSARVEYWAYVDPEAHRILDWKEVHRIRQEDPERYRKLELRCRISNVFNAEQIDGIPEYQRQEETNIDSIREQRDTLLWNMNLDYQEVGDQAYYSPVQDRVTLPPEAPFDSPYGYLCTFLHECGHATGHPSRLNRDLSGGFGSESYAREEPRAEIASVFASQELGLQMPEAEVTKHLDLHKAYIQGWISVLEHDPNELFAAIRDAGTISDYLIQAGEFSRENRTERYRPDAARQIVSQPAEPQQISPLNKAIPSTQKPAFWGQIVYTTDTGEEFSEFYDDQTEYEEELRYRKMLGARVRGARLTRTEFLEKLSRELRNARQLFAIGRHLHGNYHTELQEWAHSIAVDIQITEVNERYAAVHAWEEANNIPLEERCTVIDEHTGQILLAEGKLTAELNQRYAEIQAARQAAEIEAEQAAAAQAAAQAQAEAEAAETKPDFFGRIIHAVGAGAAVSIFYDNLEEYEAELRYQKEVLGADVHGEALTREEFLEKLSLELKTAGHEAAIGSDLHGQYREAIQTWEAEHSNPIQISEAMAAENETYAAVHAWEEANGIPQDQRCTVIDDHTGQILLADGKLAAELNQRYTEVQTTQQIPVQENTAGPESAYTVVVWNREDGSVRQQSCQNHQEAIDTAKQFFTNKEGCTAVYNQETGKLEHIYGYVSDQELPEKMRPQLQVTEFRDDKLCYQAHVKGPGIDEWSPVCRDGDSLRVRTGSVLDGSRMEHTFSNEEYQQFQRYEARQNTPVKEEVQSFVVEYDELELG